MDPKLGKRYREIKLELNTKNKTYNNLYKSFTVEIIFEDLVTDTVFTTTFKRLRGYDINLMKHKFKSDCKYKNFKMLKIIKKSVTCKLEKL